MRIIIDMQALQTVSLVRGAGLRMLTVIQEIASHANGHQVILVLNTAFQDSSFAIRDAFSGLVPAQHIHNFEMPIASHDVANSSGLKCAEIIYSHFIRGLNPDIVLLTQSLSAGWLDQLAKPVKILPQDISASGLWLENDQFDLLKLINRFESVSNPKQTAVEDRQKQLPRLAFVSPLPPEKTGIADYSAELIPALARYYEIELITDQPEVSLLNQDKRFTIRSVAWFKQNAQCYQRVLYHFGNNYLFHGQMFALIKEIPGVMVLHDFFLAHAIAGIEIRGHQPQALNKALFNSHGYLALQQRLQAADPNQVLWDYPCNLEVIQDALGVIVHSQNTQRLAKQWLATPANLDWSVIPLLREPAEKINRNQARQALNWHQDQFVVCSFGLLGPSKLNHRLLESWLKSSLAKEENCLLVFVGENDGGDYGKRLLKRIKNTGLEQRIVITGWTDTAQFRQYLAAADLGVQLRSLSRGETSAAVLDCMNYGLPTIVNANGAMADLANDAVWMLADQFTDSEMVTALETLWQDDLKRQQLATRGQQILLTQHQPSVCAEQYALSIESFYQRAANHSSVVVQALADAECLPSDESNLAGLAKTIAANFPPQPLPRQLLIDVSSIARHDLKSGIERVVRAQLLELLKNPPPGFRIEPVYLTDQGGAWHYQYARKYTCQILGIEQAGLVDVAVDMTKGDVFYAPDFYPSGVIEAHKSGLYLNWQAQGVAINFLIHDLLPIQNPEFFVEAANRVHATWLKAISESATGLICISNAVADEVNQWLQHNPPVRTAPLPIAVIHHGADIAASTTASDKTLESSAQAAELLTKLRANPSFIMVGTIEPRKGHLQTLAAFELLWQQGQAINLVIVGKEGWLGLPDKQRRTIPEIIAKLKDHKELGQRLIWLEGISDQYLEQIYATSTCLIAASEGEGFGLPLIEAAQHQLPIIARDIPVFREVAGNHAYYFKGNHPADLQQAINDWLQRYSKKQHPLSSDMPFLSWADNAKQLGGLLSGIDANPCDNLHSQYRPKPTLYIDISVVYRQDFKTGIQRVVRAILSELIQQPPVGYRVCPVYLNHTNDKWAYYPVPDDSNVIDNAPITVSSKDVLLGLDLAGGYVINAFNQGLYHQLMQAGARVYFVVYDLLPVLAPQFFNANEDKAHQQWLTCIAQSDGVICISKAVADEFASWSTSLETPLADDFSMNYFHLGADIAASQPSSGLPDDADIMLDKLAQRPSFLMVGTLEPRKGHAQTLAAFEQLWQQGIDVNLIMVGKQGWKMSAKIKQMRQHPEIGQRLFWLENISDEYLTKLYAASTCLIAASEGEGFGLPLIEAAQNKVPIIARDIAVFREVAGDHAYYFQGLDAESLAQAINNWLGLYQQGMAPDSSDMPWLTWAQSAQQLLDRLLQNPQRNCP